MAGRLSLVQADSDMVWEADRRKDLTDDRPVLEAYVGKQRNLNNSIPLLFMIMSESEGNNVFIDLHVFSLL